MGLIHSNTLVSGSDRDRMNSSMILFSRFVFADEFGVFCNPHFPFLLLILLTSKPRKLKGVPSVRAICRVPHSGLLLVGLIPRIGVYTLPLPANPTDGDHLGVSLGESALGTSPDAAR